LPWDSDIDVQVSASTIHFLASYYNMTVHTFEGRDYMLEINPQYIDVSMDDDLNMIDGRYIDTETGLFIDITTVRPKEGASMTLTCKDSHQYEVRRMTMIRSNV
jgi:DNA-binding cell septation regulator SpoVG